MKINKNMKRNCCKYVILDVWHPFSFLLAHTQFSLDFNKNSQNTQEKILLPIRMRPVGF